MNSKPQRVDGPCAARAVSSARAPISVFIAVVALGVGLLTSTPSAQTPAPTRDGAPEKLGFGLRRTRYNGAGTASVAQWIEHPPPKGRVARSIRAGGAKRNGVGG